MGTFHRVCTVNEIPAGRGLAVQVGGERVAVFNCEGILHAIGDVCPHRGGPLSDGQLDGTQIQCPWHGALFDVRTGKRLAGPSPGDVRAHPVRLSGDAVEIEVP